MKIGRFAIVFLLRSLSAYSADFHCGAGNLACLVTAINTANANNEDNLISLDAGTFTFSTADNSNSTDGPTALPQITGRITITGAEGIGTTIERGQNGGIFRLFTVTQTGYLNLVWLGIRNGTISTGGDLPRVGGGAILNRGTLNATRCAIYSNTVMSNSGIEGGAILNYGSLTIRSTDMYSNRGGDNDFAGAISSHASLLIEDSSISNNYAGYVGAISNVGTATIQRSTFAGNNVGWSTGAIANGGTLLLEQVTVYQQNGSLGVGGIANSGSMSIISSTVSGNHGTTGGIFNTGNALIQNSTVAGNGAWVDAGGSIIGPGGINNTGTVRLQNVILAFNSVLSTAAPSDCNHLTSLGNNIVGNLTGCSVQLRTTDKTGDPGLTPYMEVASVNGSGHYGLAPTSRAIDAGDNGACPLRDQLGNQRVGACDVGSTEYQFAQQPFGFSAFVRGLH